MYYKYYQVLCKTESENFFTITLKAVNEKGAKNSAKKLSNGCIIENIKECSCPDQMAGIGYKTYLMA